MDVTNRRERARRALDGYVSGPAASTRATARALAKVDNAVAVVLVEGISDQIALETAAAGRGRDLDAERVVIVPIGGAHAIGRSLTRLGLLGTRVRLAGLCDLQEEDIFRRGLVAAHVGSPRTRTDMEHLGFYVCVNDLEDELIRAVGTAGVEALFDSQGDLGSFRSFQSQPAWRGREPKAQMRRFLRSGSRRVRGRGEPRPELGDLRRDLGRCLGLPPLVRRRTDLALDSGQLAGQRRDQPPRYHSRGASDSAFFVS